MNNTVNKIKFITQNYFSKNYIDLIYDFLTKNNIKSIGLFGYNKFTTDIINGPFNKQIKFIMTNNSNIKSNIPIYDEFDYSIPKIDLIIILSLSRIHRAQRGLISYVSCPVISILDLIYNPYNFNKTERKNYMYFRDLKNKEEIINCLKDWYKTNTGKNLDLTKPKTYNEKMQWLKIFDDNQLRTDLSDKILARDYVKNKIGEQYLVPLLGIYESPCDIDYNRLPNEFVLKCNHGSGMNIIVKDKTKLNIKQTNYKLKHWLGMNYTFLSGFELQYKHIKPKIICETRLSNEDNGDLYDYKFWCFNGKVIFIQFLSERFTSSLKMAFYDREWNKQNFTYNYELDHKTMPKPNNLNEMINLAEKLAEGFKHVRVDFYRLNNGSIYFGELTFTSMTGICKWSDPKIDDYLGSLIEL